MKNPNYTKELHDSLRKIHDDLTKNPYYITLTDKMFLTICNEIELLFPGVEFEASSRLKSDYSFENKYIEYSENPKKANDPTIYDNIGIKIVVKEIPKDFKSNDQLTQQFLELINYYETILNSKNTMYGELKEYKKFHNLETILSELKYQYRYQVTADIMDTLLKKSEKLKTFNGNGIKSLKNRRKDYQNARNYTAVHAGVALNSGSNNHNETDKDFLLDLQILTEESYEVAKYGSAAHSGENGIKYHNPDIKKRKIPNFVFTSHELTPEQLQSLLYQLPKYTLYQNHKLYRLGLHENFNRYYEKEIEQLTIEQKQNIDYLLHGYDGHYLKLNLSNDKEKDMER